METTSLNVISQSSHVEFLTQLGFQNIDGFGCAPEGFVTKYSICTDDPSKSLYSIFKTYTFATENGAIALHDLIAYLVLDTSSSEIISAIKIEKCHAEFFKAFGTLEDNGMLTLTPRHQIAHLQESSQLLFGRIYTIASQNDECPVFDTMFQLTYDPSSYEITQSTPIIKTPLSHFFEYLHYEERDGKMELPRNHILQFGLHASFGLYSLCEVSRTHTMCLCDEKVTLIYNATTFVVASINDYRTN